MAVDIEISLHNAKKCWDKLDTIIRESLQSYCVSCHLLVKLMNIHILYVINGRQLDRIVLYITMHIIHCIHLNNGLTSWHEKILKEFTYE